MASTDIARRTRTARSYGRRSLVRLPRCSRGQGVVEYGVILATIVIVAVAGFNALTKAEKAYFGAPSTSAQLAPTPPSFGAFVVPHVTNTTASCSPASIYVGGQSTCTATVTDIAASPTTPTGTVSWTSTSGSVGSCSLSGSGASASCAITLSPAVGSYTLTATYSGDVGHQSSTSGGTSLSVTKRPTSTLVSVCSPATVPINAPTSCTLNVSDTSGAGATTPAGTLTLLVNGASTSSSCTPASGSSSCAVTYTPAAAGNFNLTASFAASDAVHTDCTSGSCFGTAFVLTVNARKSAVSTLTCSTPYKPNIATTCTAQVTDIDTGTTGTPTGTVSWLLQSGSGNFSATTPPNTCTLNGSGVCSINFTPSTTAQVKIQATYNGSGTYQTSSNIVTLNISPRTTSTSVSCTPPFDLSQPITCQATVTDTDTAPTNPPGGTVTWSSGGGTVSGTPCTLSGSPRACQVTFTPNATGNQTVTATYNGDDSVHQSTTGSSTLNVKRASKTTVTCSVSSAPSNSDVSCSVSVTDALGGAGTPTGTVTLTTSGNGAKASPTTCTVPTGSPSCSSITFSLSNSPRVNTLTATFTPTDAVYDSSTGSANVTGT